MARSIKDHFSQVIKDLFSIKKSNRLAHIPVLAALCIGIPLLTGLFLGHLNYGLVASTSGLVILYIPSSKSLVGRMTKLLLCSFGFMIAYAVGMIFSFDPLISCLTFGIFSVLVHWINLYLGTKPPGNFFFIMLASVASCLAYKPNEIPQKIGLIALGTLSACLLAFIYSLLFLNRQKIKEQAVPSERNSESTYMFLLEALIIGLFMFLSLGCGHLLNLENPYWVPISCLAVMQGVTLTHVWQRVIQRILGTFVGLALCWMILSFFKTPLSICICIILLQYIVEILIVRNYALAVVFITPMTLLLAEAANPLIQDPNQLLSIRFFDIAIGSLLGAIGGWFVHNEKLRNHGVQNMRKAKLAFKAKIKF